MQVKQEKHQQQLHEQENALRDGLRQVADDYAGRKELTDGALPAWPCWKWLSAIYFTDCEQSVAYRPGAVHLNLLRLEVCSLPQVAMG